MILRRLSSAHGTISARAKPFKRRRMEKEAKTIESPAQCAPAFSQTIPSEVLGRRSGRKRPLLEFLFEPLSMPIGLESPPAERADHVGEVRNILAGLLICPARLPGAEHYERRACRFPECFREIAWRRVRKQGHRVFDDRPGDKCVHGFVRIVN